MSGNQACDKFPAPNGQRGCLGESVFRWLVHYWSSVGSGGNPDAAEELQGMTRKNGFLLIPSQDRENVQEVSKHDLLWKLKRTNHQ